MKLETMIPSAHRIDNKDYVAEVCDVSVKVVRGVQWAAQLNGRKFAELRTKELRRLRSVAKLGLYDFNVVDGTVVIQADTVSDDALRVVYHVLDSGAS